MQKKALIFHGTMGSPNSNWFQWLKFALEKRGWDVTVPTFPTPEHQSLDSWNKALTNQVEYLQGIDLIVGHSLGATFILHTLEEELYHPEKIILVSALNSLIENKEYDDLNANFIKHFDWNVIKSNFKTGYILHGDNDPYVPIKQAQDIADGLNISLKTIKNGGHLNIETGYDRFPLLLDLINE